MRVKYFPLKLLRAQQNCHPDRIVDESLPPKNMKMARTN
jgi:hypothetical protein